MTAPKRRAKVTAKAPAAKGPATKTQATRARKKAPAANVGAAASETMVERGSYGRFVLARLRPNVDLVAGVERVCAAHGVAYAVVRSAVGSLVDAALGYGEGDSMTLITVEGPGIEVLSLGGEIRPDEGGKPVATLRGTISDSDASIYGGEFVRGGNPVCTSLEIALQEWLPDHGARD